MLQSQVVVVHQAVPNTNTLLPFAHPRGLLRSVHYYASRTRDWG